MITIQSIHSVQHIDYKELCSLDKHTAKIIIPWHGIWIHMQSFSIPAEISHIRVSWAANCTCVSAWADGSYDSRSQIMLHVGVSFSVLSFFPAICVYPIHRMVGVTSLGPWKDPFLHREFRRVLFCQIVTKGTGMGNHVMSPRGRD